MELVNISKSYGDKCVFENFSLVIPDGSRIVISGHSGRGKTTLLRLLMGLEKPDSGVIYGLPQTMSAVFQEDRLPMDFTAYNCVRYALPKSVTKERIMQSFAELGLKGEEHKPVRELSGGMRRRVAIIRAVLYPSEALFLDEAFTGLDPKTKCISADYILSNSEGRTLVAVSHSKEDANLLSATETAI